MTRAQKKFPPFSSNESHFSYLQTVKGAPSLPSDTYQASENEKSSFDFLSRVEQKLAQYNASENIIQRWLFEILSIITSAVCMGERPLDCVII
jgi:hypothetical protein